MIALILAAILSLPGDTYEIKYREVWTPVQTCINGRCYTTYEKRMKAYYVKTETQPVPKKVVKKESPKKTQLLFGLLKPVKKTVEKKKPLTFGL